MKLLDVRARLSVYYVYTNDRMGYVDSRTQFASLVDSHSQNLIC